ncbi:MAG: MBL fold metallo-hydrolase [Chloroflexi bacterium]|nr:MAG: MBL fold metallo-hydrolase [Chloroflexota bacterium]MBL1196034.1 MBL fold metallo-hydrolase [Chloroflexota bacterium]NOH13328.1 MBL fold metallo-hydrolase [Chloroflexota bacterium]
MATQSEIDPGTLRAWLDEGKDVDVIDIRPEADYQSWHIPGSKNIDVYNSIKFGQAGALADYQPLNRNPVVAVCYVGQTSKAVVSYLRSRDIEAMSLTGGMQWWSLAWNLAEVPLMKSTAKVIQIRRTGKGCLSYLVGSGNQAVVIDPSVDPELYVELAGQNGWQITSIIDTHVHADHLSRGRLLAVQTGAKHYLPEQERTKFEHPSLKKGDVIEFGDSLLKVMHTPGHTFEAISLLLDDEALFTGDTLFTNSVGRPDLKASPQESEQRARALYNSLQQLSELPQDTLILACHTSQPIPFDRQAIVATLGEAVENVEILKSSEDDFVTWVLGRIPPTPPNHLYVVQFNEMGVWPEGDPTQLEAGGNNCAV